VGDERKPPLIEVSLYVTMIKEENRKLKVNKQLGQSQITNGIGA